MKLATLTLAAVALVAAAPATSPYNPREAFAPFPMDVPSTLMRTASGVPGPNYWQNRADYKLNVMLDPATHVIRGTAEIAYTNKSPDKLDSLWLDLEQNRYKPDSRGNLTNGRPGGGTTDGMVLESVSVDGKAVQPIVSDTRAQLRLAAPMAHGGKALVRIAYHYTVPAEPWGGRTGWMTTPTGDIYSVAQWYPRVAVYDDLRGWDPLPYLAQEFYNDYGTFDYAVTVPGDWLVAGSGGLTNPAEVLSATERQRWAAAAKSDKTVMIRSAAEAAARRGGPAETWRFHMDNSRDVAFATSPAFIWDAARIRLPGGKSSMAMSFYPPESGGEAAWGRSTEYMKDAVERFSAKWYPYPWPAAINIAGPASGMEYPGIVFDGVEDKGKELFWISAHEIGHSWFPMIVGFDERRNAWMDEGFNTFIDVYESDEFQGGVYGPKRDGEYAPHGGNPVDEILPILADPNAPPILTRADSVIEKYRHPVTYFKSALALVLLREQILGPERFDPAFRRFIATWAFKHPTPSDFFRAMESETGEDLSYWWRGWYANNWSLDFAASAIKPIPARFKQAGSLVTVEARDKLIMPVTMRVTFADGTRRDIKLPAETFIRTSAADVPVLSASPVVRADLDPEHKIPDANRANNLVTVGSAG